MRAQLCSVRPFQRRVQYAAAVVSISLRIAGTLMLVEFAGIVATNSRTPTVTAALALLLMIGFVALLASRRHAVHQYRLRGTTAALQAVAGLLAWSGIGVSLGVMDPGDVAAETLALYLPAFAEEVLFRGMLLQGIRLHLRDRHGIGPAPAALLGALLSALAFAVAHFPAEHVLRLTVPAAGILRLTSVGLLLTAVYWTAGPWMAFAVHASFNTQVNAGISRALAWSEAGAVGAIATVAICALAVRYGCQLLSRSQAALGP